MFHLLLNIVRGTIVSDSLGSGLHGTSGTKLGDRGKRNNGEETR